MIGMCCNTNHHLSWAQHDCFGKSKPVYTVVGIGYMFLPMHNTSTLERTFVAKCPAFN